RATCRRSCAVWATAGLCQRRARESGPPPGGPSVHDVPALTQRSGRRDRAGQPTDGSSRGSTAEDALESATAEDGIGVGGGALRDLGLRPAGRGGDRRPDQPDETGLVLATAARYRREVRRVGLDEEPVERRQGGGGADVVGAREGHDAAVGEVRAEIEG